LSDFPTARADLQRVVELEPNHGWASRALAWSYVSGPEKLHAAAKALPLIQRAVQRAPRDWYALNTLGVVYYRLGRYKQALAALERSFGESQGDLAAGNLLFLALSHARLGDAIQARNCYDRAVGWLREHRDELESQEQEEVDAFQAEARAVLDKGTNP
jgi:tetratricopeptide (TPR) repeat protein